MINDVENGMGFSGLVPTKAEQSAEDAFRVERDAFDRMQKNLMDEIARLNSVIRGAHQMLAPLAHSPIPSVLIIRQVVDALRFSNKP